MVREMVLVDVVMPIALGMIMLGLGLSLTLADFRRVLSMPQAVLVGLGCQMVILPAAAFGLAKAFALPPEMAVGLMLVSASPGGPSANLYSHLARGDVALNITLTAVNSVLSLVTLPLIVGFALRYFMAAEREVPIQLGKVIQVFSVVLVPVIAGMIIKARAPAASARAERPVKLLSALFLLLVIVGAVIQERARIGGYFRQVGLAALAFNLTSMTVGYLVPLLARLGRKQAIAIGMEIGIHNGTLAIAVANTVLASTAMAIPAAIYSLIMFFTAAAFGLLVSRKAQ